MARKSRKLAQSTDSVTVKPPVFFSSYVYARISKESDRSDDSIDNQIEICKGYINSDNELILSGVFADLGYSGTNFDRPGYAEMIAGILCGDVQCVVVKDLSRLGRTYIEVGELIFDTFVQHGVRFISVNDHYDSFSDDAGRKKLLILFKNLINHMYSRDLGKKIKSAHDAKKKCGEPAGAPPYGYRSGKDKKRLEIDSDAAENVKMIFNMRLQGESAISITKYLNQMGIPSPQNRRYQLGEITHKNFSERIVWNNGMVSKLLHNKTYTGSLIQGKYTCVNKKHTLLPKEQWIVHENAHEAIISKEQFEAVAKLMQESAAKYKHTGETVNQENRYAGKIICSRCGKTALRSDGGKPDNIVYYYCCRHCINDLKFETGLKRAPLLPLVKLDAIVTDIISRHMDLLGQFDNLREILKQSKPFHQKKTQLVREKARYEKTVSNTERNLSAAYAHHLDGLLDTREYELVRIKIERDKQEAETRIMQLKTEQKKYDINSALENQWLVKYRAFRDFETPTKELVQTLISRIYLTPLTNEVKVELNFTDYFNELLQLKTESEGTVDVRQHSEIGV